MKEKMLKFLALSLRALGLALSRAGDLCFAGSMRVEAVLNDPADQAGA